ncbi:M67 family metallopeptidase [Thermotoga sp. SG1]|uniref:M67 family metallopeptidase n=1 Tax=Thermotoga sp. SG1 TaxID=126739 RepID=UPI000C7690F6|nr:M67 family metallopeptidase [Thermotoga sp. SG1]PLV56297.1 hypothetical protein AS006_06985 [Thermotoga sp. SG1]
MSTLILRKSEYKEIIDHCFETFPFEACGLLAGTIKNDQYEVLQVFRMSNIAEDPARNYLMDPKEQFNVFKQMRKQQLCFLGIYHSHPLSDPFPSKKDVEMAYYPEAVYIIVSLKHPQVPRVKAFRILNGEIFEVELIIKEVN